MYCTVVSTRYIISRHTWRELYLCLTKFQRPLFRFKLHFIRTQLRMCVRLDCVYCDFWSLDSTKYRISLPSSRELVFAWQKNSEALFLTSLTPQANTPYMCESWLCVVYCAFWTLVSTRYKISWHTSKRQHPPFLLEKKEKEKNLATNVKLKINNIKTLENWEKHRKDCESCPLRVSWKVKFEMNYICPVWCIGKSKLWIIYT